MTDLEFRALIVLAENDVIYNRESLQKYGQFMSDPNTPHIQALAKEMEARRILTSISESAASTDFRDTTK